MSRSYDLATVAEPTGPPSYTRSRTRSNGSITTARRIESGLESVEHLAHDVGLAADTVERTARIGRRVVRRWERVEDHDKNKENAGRQNDTDPSRDQAQRDENGRQSLEERKNSTSPAALNTFRASLAEAQQFVDEIRQLSRKITMKRQALTGVAYSSFKRHVNESVPFSVTEENHLEAMTTTVRRQVLVVYHTIQALKAEFPEYCAGTGRALLTTREASLLGKELKQLYATFADELDLIELRAEDERREVESGVCDERLRRFILEHEPGMQEQEVLRELKIAKEEQRTTNVNRLAPSSFSRRLALELPFIEISRSLSVIDKHEKKSPQQAVTDSGSLFDRAISGLKHAFWHTQASVSPPARRLHSSAPDDLAQSRVKDTAVLLEEGKKPKKEKHNGNSDSDSDVSISELLGPDGQLPYTVPSDSTDVNAGQEDPLAEAKHKYKLQKHARPFLIAEWVLILALVLYWAVARFAFNWDNPLGNVDLGSHFGDDAWGDTGDGIPATISMSSFTGQLTKSAETSQPSQLMALVTSAQYALTATAAPTSD